MGLTQVWALPDESSRSLITLPRVNAGPLMKDGFFYIGLTDPKQQARPATSAHSKDEVFGRVHQGAGATFSG